MKIVDDTVTFECSGRELYANDGIIGIAPDGYLYYGFDGSFPEFADRLSEAERKELAEHMIAAWTKVRDS